MKKLFPDEKGTKKEIKEFLDKKGFYIVLLLCIAVVAGTVVFVTTRNATSNRKGYEARDFIPEEGENEAIWENEDEGGAVAVNEAEGDLLNAQEADDKKVSATIEQNSGIGDPASITNTDNTNIAQSKDDKDKTAPKESTAPEKKADPKASGSKTTQAEKQQSFKMPVDGEISFEYAMDRLVYSKTLEEWRVHSGVDIASERGTPVKAVADGVVCDIRNDSYYGISVVIDHGNDLKTLYRNLASDEIVSVNQKVKQGEVIGSIGNTALDESSEQPHLHFEVFKKGVNTDPMAYLPKSGANGE